MVTNYINQVQRACEATKGIEFKPEVVDDCWDMVDIIPDETRRRNKEGPRELKEFIFVDGEGVDHRTDDPKYILFGTSTGERIKGPSLGTEQMLEFLIKLKVKHPKAVFIGFALNYDVNMILRDVSPDRLERIRKAKRTRWGNYTIHYMPSKKFMVTHNPSRTTFFWSDMFTYCACSFVKACEQYLGKDDPRLVKVMAGKEHRNEFTYAELDDFIEPYMSLELELGVELITRLRHYLYEADIYPALWHGPGSVATALLKSRGVRHAMKPPTGQIQDASRYAYFGGRFEVFKTGYYNGPVYQADINSAYPYALTLVPNLATGEWVRRLEPTKTDTQFKLFKLRFKNRKLNPTGWNPLPTRSIQHTIHYQSITNGWYWGPEAEILLEAYADSTVVECVYEYEDDGERPFDFINEMYSQRAEWKRTGNQAQLALKLGMNSMYGKLAQRVGWNEETMSAPPSHQLEWAGFATSKCRAMVLEKMLQQPEDIIGVETDGIFSSVPLDVDEGKGLGQWEVERWDGIIYIQSGVYFKRSAGEWIVSKTRGFGKNTLSCEDALMAVDGLKTMTAEQSRFVGMARAGSENWRQFQKMPHDVQWGGNGKRFHNPKFCVACRDGGTWHDTMWRRAPGDNARNSYPHVLPWLDGYVNPFQNEQDASEAVQEDFEEEEWGFNA